MKNIFTLLFVFLLNDVWATNYYFSSSTGDDSRTSTQAINPSTPWKSLNKLNSYFSSLQPGDSVLFKRGETFYGSITVNKSGTATAPIVISAYGTGAKPVITGLTTLNNWVAVGNGVYQSYNPSLGDGLSILLLNDVPKSIGRYPNLDAPNKGYLTLESHGTNTITDNELTSTPNWTGAELVLRSNHWKLDKYKITGHSANTITYSGNYAQNKYGYFIQNSPKTLDQLGEWYYDPSTKKVSVFFGSNSPSLYNVKACGTGNLIFSESKSYVVLNELNIKGANKDAIVVKFGSYFSIKNCDILSSGKDGVNVFYHPNFTIENCSVLNCYNTGITVYGSAATNAIVRNNRVKNTYYVEGMGQGGDNQGAGISVTSKNSLIEYNSIINSGYLGIRFDADYCLIKNNFIDTFCYVKDDGAGIYTHNNANITYTGRKIKGNIVMNGIGAGSGTNTTNSAAQGIYLDDNTNGVEVTDNTVANCNRGMYLHNSRNIVVKNNTLYNNNDGQIYMGDDALGGLLRNHTITNNILFAKIAKQVVSSINTEASGTDIKNMGRLDSNYYARPIDDRSIISTTAYLNSSSKSTVNFDLEGWKLNTSLDATSKASVKIITPYKVNSLLGLNKSVYGSFNLSTDIKKTWANSCTATWANSGVLDGGYLKIVPLANNSIVFNGLSLVAGKKYIVKYSVKGAGRMSISAYLRGSSTLSYAALTLKQYRTINTTRTENEMIFSPSKSDVNGTLVFAVDGLSAYYLDNVEVYEADATITNPDDSIRFVINPSATSKTFSLDGNYVDAKNNKFSNSIILQPYETAVLIRNGGIQNAPPSVQLTSPAANATVTAPGTVVINATATDADGTIKQVDFYNGSILLGTATASPYTFTWNNVPKGTYTITAKATDNNLAVATSAAVQISVRTPNVAPSVVLTSPITNAIVATPASVTITATATDTDGKISKVSFYNGTTLMGTSTTSPYSFTWSNVAKGAYTITAKATDDSLAVTTSAAVRITVYTPNIAPSVTLTSPTPNSIVSGPSSVTITAAAADSDGKINKVDFYSNDTLIGTTTINPYTFNWNTPKPGTYTITAKATDDSLAVTTSAPVSITFSNTNNAPLVVLTSPKQNSTIAAPASIIISAEASDIEGSINVVEFYNADTLIGAATASPYIFIWNNVPNGNYTITAKATDNSLLSAVSAAVNISVYTPVVPSVSLTSPVATTTYVGPATVRLTASASDLDGSISKVEFYNDTILVGTVNTAPYTFSWSNVKAGVYSITAKATDNSGLSTTSTAFILTVAQNQLPTVKITSPVINATYNGPATIYMSAIASDADGSITKVEFYNGTTLLCIEKIAPYTYSWVNVPAGTYTITAKATDNKGAVTTSSSVTTIVLPSLISLKSSENTDTSSVTANVHALQLRKDFVTANNSETYDVKVFPNPATSRLQLDLHQLKTNNEKANVLVQTISGITVKNISVVLSGRTIEVDVNNLASGTYIVSIVSDNFKISKKFIKN